MNGGAGGDGATIIPRPRALSEDARSARLCLAAQVLPEIQAEREPVPERDVM